MLTQDAKRLKAPIEIQENPAYLENTVEQLEDDDPIDIVDNENEPTVEADLEDLTMN